MTTSVDFLCNAITALTSPQLYDLGMSAIQEFREGRHHYKLHPNVNLWTSVWTGCSMIVNRITPFHRMVAVHHWLRFVGQLWNPQGLCLRYSRHRLDSELPSRNSCSPHWKDFETWCGGVGGWWENLPGTFIKDAFMTDLVCQGQIGLCMTVT